MSTKTKEKKLRKVPVLTEEQKNLFRGIELNKDFNLDNAYINYVLNKKKV